MRKEFEWYFPASEEEVNSIWKKGVLTIDANVLLDLYRYHESTRNALIGSLKEFKGRLWLSNQAAEEFIRNRSNVIVSSEKALKQAIDEVEKLKNNLDSTLSQLKGNRIIPAEIGEKLAADIYPIISSALEKIEGARSDYPQYLKDDPILDELTGMFENSIGESLPEPDIQELRKEAEERKKNKVPPGYMDDDKDGDRQFGDFFLWRQILLKSKADAAPIIFVTSERKEDWWEKISGKTIGPRPELLREAYQFGGQRIFIYQTDRFLEYSSQHSGSAVDSSAVDEIRAVDSLRSNADHAVEVVEQSIIEATDTLQEGILVLNLKRPVKTLTGRGQFDPPMYNSPVISVKLTSSPAKSRKYKLRAGTGTNCDFNLHVISGEDGQLLPTGQYILKYRATCAIPESNSVTIAKLAEVVGTSPQKLLEIMLASGIEAVDEGYEISDSEKMQLLHYLKSNENDK